ncbi:MAG: hypothetical protein E7468_00135 [Ruminococcaceae bacterium]|nr:hypothetical protein [Oscillospiraceae bacterium]
MDEMESKLGAILGNPDMMAQIMSMAQKLSGSNSAPAPPQPPPQPAMPSLPDGLDMGMLMKLAGMANSANIDQNQKGLLIALRPYLVPERISKLEKAMRAAKLANIASSILGSGILTQAGR